MRENSRPILLIDALNLFTRHFIANPTISQNGEHVGGIVGFLKAIQLLCERFRPRKIYVAWEGGGSSRRRKIQSSYKNFRRPQKLNRYYDDDEIPDTLENRNWQISSLIRFLNFSGVNQIYVADCEADDVIGYICESNRDTFKIIISSDKDLYQLIDDKTFQWSPGQKKLIQKNDVFEKFGIFPENFCLIRSFIGDASDNIIGIKGAGFKSMIKRFPEVNQRSFLVEDLINLAVEKSKSSKIKLYKEIAENSSVPLDNWKLMSLEYRNLSAFQVEKIEHGLSKKNDKRNKLNFVRDQSRIGITNFDVDRFFMSTRNLN